MPTKREYQSCKTASLLDRVISIFLANLKVTAHARGMRMVLIDTNFDLDFVGLNRILGCLLLIYRP